MKRKLHRHSFIHRYRHVYIFISILVISGFLMGCFASRYISASDIEQLSSILTTVPEDMDQYSFFINQFFLGIVLIVVVFPVRHKPRRHPHHQLHRLHQRGADRLFLRAVPLHVSVQGRIGHHPGARAAGAL